MNRRNLLLLAALVLLVATPVAAHTRLERSVPSAGSTVLTSPPHIALWFSEPLEPAFSKLELFGQDNRAVDHGDSQVDPEHGEQISVSLPELAAGTYRVHWRVLSVDSHVNEGDFTFDVRP